MNIQQYRAFLETKKTKIPESGFVVDDSELNPMLFPFQKHCIMVFRKEGEHMHPVTCDITVDTWQKWASPVWMDIDYGNTLNKMDARGEKDEKHICPLQLDTIDRAVQLWSNKGDIVLTPFMGIGSEVYQAILDERKGIGFELKESYFNEAVKNVQVAEAKVMEERLF